MRVRDKALERINNPNLKHKLHTDYKWLKRITNNLEWF